MERTQEQRIEDVAKELFSQSRESGSITWERVGEEAQESFRKDAEAILRVADAPPKLEPKWPTQESLDALQDCCDIYGVPDPIMVREAFLADGIIKAAIELRDAGPSDCPDQAGDRVIDAVNKAGL
jgi:hypothetical protein